jgi:1-acyl-sn-glycerol-3-phosphate acyltransferase
VTVLRRALMTVVVAALGVLAVVLLPVVALGQGLVALGSLARRRPVRGRVLRLWVFAVAYLLGEVAVLLTCAWLWLRAGSQLAGPAAQERHVALLERALGGLVGLAERVFGFALQVHEPRTQREDRAHLRGEEPVLVLGRHAGPGASFVLIHLLLTRYGRAPRIVLTDRLRWDPAVDVLLSRLGARFIGRGGTQAVDAVRDLAAGLRPGDALVLFPEGGDWTPTRQRRAVQRLRRRGLHEHADRAAAMVHVLPPRPAGTIAALEAAPAADVVVFMHTGHDDLQDAQTVWAGLPLRRELDVLWWREAAEQVPEDEDGITDWLFATWGQIDAWVQEQGHLEAVREPEQDALEGHDEP